MSPEAVVAASAALYEAAVTPDEWPAALQKFARATGSAGCLFYPERPEAIGLQFPASPDIAGLLADFVRDGWWRNDHRAVRGWPLLRSGRKVIVDHDVASDEERRTLPYYRDFLGRHGLPWWAAIGFAVEGRRWCMPILRTASQGAFTPAEMAALEEAAGHFEKFVGLAGKIAVGRARSAVEALERIGRAGSRSTGGEESSPPTRSPNVMRTAISGSPAPACAPPTPRPTGACKT